MNKNNHSNSYETPLVEVMDIKVEKGFAESPGGTGDIADGDDKGSF